MKRPACSASRVGVRRPARRSEQNRRLQTRVTSRLTQMTNRLAAEVLEILAVGDEPVNQAQSTLCRLRRNRVNQIIEHAFGDHAEQFAHLGV